jgi:hypothetical protein
VSWIDRLKRLPAPPPGPADTASVDETPDAFDWPAEQRSAARSGY